MVSREERGLAGALGVVGYRLAMLVSGALALVLVAGSGWIPALGWRNTYLLMAALMAVGVFAALDATTKEQSEIHPDSSVSFRDVSQHPPHFVGR